MDGLDQGQCAVAVKENSWRPVVNVFLTIILLSLLLSACVYFWCELKYVKQKYETLLEFMHGETHRINDLEASCTFLAKQIRKTNDEFLQFNTDFAASVNLCKRVLREKFPENMGVNLDPADYLERFPGDTDEEEEDYEAFFEERRRRYRRTPLSEASDPDFWMEENHGSPMDQGDGEPENVQIQSSNTRE